ncbi:Bromodomain-containing protein [Cubamyces sp. BRFM 1775]|nr:Bromodomain-containing protein [Cubamyces sp. BRFM 1775]
MSKREARTFAAAGVDVDAPRAKRRKEAPATASTSPNGKKDPDALTATVDAQQDDENTESTGEDKEMVREKGLQLWQTLKDAVNKEGQIASFQFMRLPSKRQYPDYYIQIKRPIALDDIKAKLEAREYTSLNEVLQDFETCFRNAKRYNMKESQIWKDAKFLHKLVTKEYSRMTGTKEEAPADDGDEKGASEDETSGKKKAPNMHRLLKSRLQKLVDKADEKGRVLSAEFMELPSRKQWPMYYQIIKKPQALENIFKKLKRKEYHNPTDFANDVELVFSNALEFNQEHTQIWDDAVHLREYFRKLMADLPEPYTIPAYANAGEHATKVKLKMPTAPTQPIAAPTPTLPSSNKITVPGAYSASSTAQAPIRQSAPTASTQPHRPPTTIKSPPVTPAIPPTPTPAASTPAAVSQPARVPPIAPAPPTAAATSTVPKATHAGALQPATFTPAANPVSYYPNAVYQQSLAPAVTPKGPPAIAPAVPAPTLAPTLAPIPTAPAVAARPSPAANQDTFPLKHAVVTTLPLGRRLVLSHEEGVKTWAVRLSGVESSVILSDVTLLSRAEDGDESSGDEDHEYKGTESKHEEEEGTTTSPKTKKRGRPPRKRGKGSDAKKAKGKAAEAPGGVQVKLNSAVLKAKEEGVWEVQLPPGLSIIEFGEKGGMVWKVYLDRAAY